MAGKYISNEMLVCLKRYWGYTQFRPWQEDTILAVLEERDSLTVLPTGGGKSLCFQLPALLKEGMSVVILPLISLMKDQVDGLKDMGIDAEYLNSSQPAEEQRAVIARIRARKVKLLYISPERLRAEWTVNLLKIVPLSFFVIDEAHCISHWGHDFREDYRNLKVIKERFADLNIHAFTATATQEVQLDILEQLSLQEPYINIAFVIHAGLPKSIEHYHQETGRAGRDGLPSYCYMFYAGADFRLWSFFAEQSADKEVMMDKLRKMYNFCARPQCRHKELAGYFNQEYNQQSCQSCDYCLEEVEMVDQPLKIGQAVLGCVESLTFGEGGGFGAGYIANVLKGALTDQITRWGHKHSRSFGMMSAESLVFIRSMIEQLIGQCLLKREGEYATLSLTDSGRRLLSGEGTLILAKPAAAKKKKEISARQKEKKDLDWAGVDEGLFELLRRKRAELAQKQGVPAYIIFGDRSLKDMTALKPLTLNDFSAVFGVGEHKLKMYSEAFLGVIRQYSKQNSASLR